MDALLCQISRFPLKLTSFNLSNQHAIPTKGLQAFSQKITTLTSLTCSNIAHLHTNDFFLIADCFPLLEELNLGNPTYIEDASNYPNGVEALLSKLLNLRKINLSFHRHINNRSLFRLFRNCKLLEEVIISKSYSITYASIAFAICERPTLRYLSFSMTPTMEYGETYLTSHFNGIRYLSSLNISDELLYSIAMKSLPLKRLVLGHCTGYSYDGIRCLLSKLHLDIQNAKVVNNYNIDYLSFLLSNLESINLSHGVLCSMRSILENTSIGEMGLGLENYSPLLYFVVNPQMKMKRLHLANNSSLNDETIKLFASICPNLQLLDLGDCRCISKGIVEVLRCSKITQLNLTSCPKFLNWRC
ncbi:putative leucine-rich repeat domain, L domain-containing protein [Medicago truncatula]|uniref:Putative leucine-rich repeat domain, L domain-containing protein n=1 Tax=Medicago truncatula TaxID=3880 RepID=A0A396I0U8_MEDTR|nr:putative leucine-rich repeat domain, L domain-containing protein [Medicago truncatula]